MNKTKKTKEDLTDMVTSEGIKRLAKQLGADLCGIASMDRF